jgi:hypothetical protein
MTAKAKTRVARAPRLSKSPHPTRAVLQKEIRELETYAESLKHRESGTRKHKASKKHSAKRGLALAAEDVACCSAEALAATLRLAGRQVAEADVLALYWHTASDPDAGASVLATLEAAARTGLAGCRPVFEEVMPHVPGLHDDRPGRHEIRAAGLILGTSLPGGPHSVAVGPDGTWWSWGEPYSPVGFPGAVIEECWAVTWQ